MSVMLYKCPGPHVLHGVKCEYNVVDEEQVEAQVANGWFRSPLEAEKAFSEPVAESPAVVVVKKKRGRKPKAASLKKAEEA